MQANVRDLEDIYNSHVGTMDIETLRQQIMHAAHSNSDFSSAALSGASICLVYRDIIPIILDLPDPDDPVTDGSSISRKLSEKEVVK